MYLKIWFIVIFSDFIDVYGLYKVIKNRFKLEKVVKFIIIKKVFVNLVFLWILYFLWYF